MYTFRAAQQSDLENVLKFPLNRTELFYFFPSAAYPLTLEQLEKQLSSRHESIIMLEDEQLVGFANFYNVEKHNIAFIGNVIIKPDKRRLGLGQKLLQQMINNGFTKLQLKEVHLSCYQDNIPALSFYKKIGFKAYAKEERLDFNDLPTQLIHMRISKGLGIYLGAP